MQETRVWSLTPGGAHMPWNNWARAPQLLSLCSRAQKLQLLSPCATTTDARAPGAHAPQWEKPPQWGAHTLQLESSLGLPQLEKSQPALKTQYSQKKKLVWPAGSRTNQRWAQCWASLVARIGKTSLQCRRPQFNPWVGKVPWRRKWQPTLYSCLENSMDRGAWHAAIHGVAKSQPWLSH